MSPVSWCRDAQGSGLFVFNDRSSKKVTPSLTFLPASNYTMSICKPFTKYIRKRICIFIVHCNDIFTICSFVNIHQAFPSFYAHQLKLESKYNMEWFVWSVSELVCVYKNIVHFYQQGLFQEGQFKKKLIQVFCFYSKHTGQSILQLSSDVLHIIHITRSLEKSASKTHLVF